jgi:hypothetical protein
MRGIIPSRVPALVFGAGIATVLAFGATSAMAAPGQKAAEPFFCGFHAYEESCNQCCGRFEASWQGIECYCDPGTKM